MTELALLCLVLVLVAVAWAIHAHNRLVALAAQVTEAWSDIQVQLRRRHDLIPNLAETVRAHAAHERATIEAALRARDAAAADQGGPDHRARSEQRLEQRLAGLLAVGEAVPALGADRSFHALAQALAEAETRLKRARRFYNGSVRLLNVAVRQVPTNLVARAAGIRAAAYFGTDGEPGQGGA